MARTSCEFVVPDLDLGEVPIRVSLWLVPIGREVSEGERLVELLAGDVTVDLPAPASGVLASALVEEEEQVRVGQVLGVILAAE